MRHELQNWQQFIRAEGHIFRDYPSLIFQQAANSPRGTLQAAAAEQLGERQRKRSAPWLRWRNKPQGGSASVLVLRHSAAVFDCSISSAAGLLATCSYEALQIWSLQSGEELVNFRNEKHWNSCAISKDGSRVVAGEKGGTLVLLSVKTGSRLAEIQPMASHNVQWLDENFVLATGDENVFQWDTRRSEYTLLAREHEEDFIHDCCLSPDRTRIAVATNFGLSIRDLSTGELKHQFTDDKGRFLACAWIDNQLVACGSDSSPLYIFDAASGMLQKTLGPTWIRSCSMSPDGVRLATASGSAINIWDTRSGKMLASLKEHTHLVGICAWSPAGDLLVSGSFDSTARIWDGSSLRATEKSPRHLREVNHVAVSLDSKTVVTGSDDKTIKIWNSETGGLRQTLDHVGRVTGVAITPSGDLVSTAEVKPPCIWQWDRSRSFESALNQIPSEPLAMDLSPDGTLVACLCGDETLRLWSVYQEYIAEVAMVRDVGGLCEAKLCRFSPDGRYLFSVAPRNRLLVYDVLKRCECFRTQKDWINPASKLAANLLDAAFSPDGTRVVAPVAGGVLQVYEAMTGRELVRLRSNEYDVWTVAWSTDGRLIAAGGDEHVISIWDAASGLLLSRLVGHRKRVNHCVFSPRASLLASVSLLDQQTFIWDANEGTVLGVFQGIAGKQVAWGADGSFIVVGGDEGVVGILGLESFGNVLTP